MQDSADAVARHSKRHRLGRMGTGTNQCRMVRHYKYAPALVILQSLENRPDDMFVDEFNGPFFRLGVAAVRCLVGRFDMDENDIVNEYHQRRNDNGLFGADPSTCPSCSQVIDACTSVRGKTEPVEGSLTLCIYCGAVLQFVRVDVGWSFKKAPKEVLEQIPKDELEWARNMVKRFNLDMKRKEGSNEH